MYFRVYAGVVMCIGLSVRTILNNAPVHANEGHLVFVNFFYCTKKGKMLHEKKRKGTRDHRITSLVLRAEDCNIHK